MTVLLLDCNYLAWRSFHTTGKNLDRGTTYGFLSTLQKLRDQFQPERIAFCFDGGGPSKRQEIYPDYKGNRIAKPKDFALLVVHQEIKELRDKHLKDLGWRNVFHSPGLEADDVIASICKGGTDGGLVVVSADHDLYQLLDDDRVRMWEPSRKRLLDASMFRDEWGISPAKWVNVKAIAGCSSDNIQGIRGIGEKTAAKYLKFYEGDRTVWRSAKPGMQNLWKKVQANADLIKFNLRLVGLPFAGCPTFKLRNDEATGGKWLRWCEANGMKSLLRRSRLERQS